LHDYQNKGDRNWGATLRVKNSAGDGFRQKWGRTVRMELEYTRQSIKVSFTMSIDIFKVFE